MEECKQQECHHSYIIKFPACQKNASD